MLKGVEKCPENKKELTKEGAVLPTALKDNELYVNGDIISVEKREDRGVDLYRNGKLAGVVYYRHEGEFLKKLGGALDRLYPEREVNQRDRATSIYRKNNLGSCAGITIHNESEGIVIPNGKEGEFVNQNIRVGLRRMDSGVDVSLDDKNPELLKYSDVDSFAKALGRHLDKKIGTVALGQRANSISEAKILYEALKLQKSATPNVE